MHGVRIKSVVKYLTFVRVNTFRNLQSFLVYSAMNYHQRITDIEERNRRIKERIAQLEAQNQLLRQIQTQILSQYQSTPSKPRSQEVPEPDLYS